MKADFLEISDELFLQLGKMVTQKYGIKMPPNKKIMFQARLQRHLRELEVHSFNDYAKKILNEGAESAEFNLLADYISTNKTEFFREMDHFNFMTNRFLPEFLEKKSDFSFRPLKIWSAGCSSGQEIYSIGIVIEDFMQKKAVRFDYSILGTDISRRMLKAAREAVYPIEQVDDVSLDLKRRYFLKSKEINDSKVRVIKEIRDKVRIAYMNLMDDSYSLNTKFDVVFLRNTLIYFEHNVQQNVLLKVLEHLNTGGCLFIGHSESLINMNLPLQSIAPSVYIKTNT